MSTPGVGIKAVSYTHLDVYKRQGLRQIMPTLVLAALAAAGRILFGPIPDFKPVSAIAIIAGATLGRRNGFMVGALAALTSNFFFGQGMWTPWQMYAWGEILLADLQLAGRNNFSLRAANNLNRRIRHQFLLEIGRAHV